ncbi:trypsin epsilon [Manduca sexta]|uniref:Peptidase S1 domain-containing protein n=1 Tax=Manduca sexta TaxID=7130 RepID=A0A922CN64_MANSE|nr:trypsin epsilon [Manduca sexta]KAG6451548.1 hypothetical protein O3G_MSEX007225 [Manduca sexta]
MKAACIILTVLILIAILAVCVMVKFATDIAFEERKREHAQASNVFQLVKTMGVIALNENVSLSVSDRFPYLAAITRNSSNSWSFACFGSVILIKWVVTSAHCRKPGTTHRVLLLHDYSRNSSLTYPVLFWRLHEKYNSSKPTPKYDIAVAKLNVDFYQFSMKSSLFDDKLATVVEASVWKTVSTMDKKVYLTNDFDKFDARVVDKTRCYEGYGVDLDDSLMCVDMSPYEDCFVFEFGPLYAGDKVVGVLAVKPADCDTKLAIFTNVSHYTNWIMRSTHTNYR